MVRLGHTQIVGTNGERIMVPYDVVNRHSRRSGDPSVKLIEHVGCLEPCLKGSKSTSPPQIATAGLGSGDSWHVPPVDNLPKPSTPAEHADVGKVYEAPTPRRSQS